MSSCQNNSHEIILDNVNKSEKLICRLYLLKGSVRNPCRYTTISISSHIAIEYSCSFCPSSGKFKALVGDLVDGQNHLTITYCNAVTKLTLTYESPVNVKYTVQVLYIVCKGHDGCFQSPSTENNVDEACARLTVGIKLIQSLYCDKLLEQGFGRKTFQLSSGCVPFYSQLPVDDAKRMDENSLWNHFAREVIAAESQTLENKKFIGFIGCTEYRGISDGNYSHENFKSKTVANAALGGGDFAVFGTGCLYTWPRSISDIMGSFESTTPVDLKHFLDDSNSRKTFGGCFATTLGSVCHEVGHIFDLGHSQSGIMGNGFDFVNRVFTVRNQTDDLPNRITGTVTSQQKTNNDPRLTKIKNTNKFLNVFHYQKGKDLTYFERNSAITLAYHKWFNQYSDSDISGDVSCTKIGGKRVISSKLFPIRLVELRDKDNALMISHYSFLDENVLEFSIPGSFVEDSCDVFVVDNIGNIFKY